MCAFLFLSASFSQSLSACFWVAHRFTMNLCIGSIYLYLTEMISVLAIVFIFRYLIYRSVDLTQYDFQSHPNTMVLALDTILGR